MSTKADVCRTIILYKFHIAYNNWIDQLPSYNNEVKQKERYTRPTFK